MKANQDILLTQMRKKYGVIKKKKLKQYMKKKEICNSYIIQK